MTASLYPNSSLETQILASFPGMSNLNPQDVDIARQYIDTRNEYDYSTCTNLGVNWYDTVHTFFLLVLEAEGR